MDESEFAKRIGALLRAAREKGELEPLSHYQRRFRGFENLVAREYAILEREARGPVSSGGIARDWVPPDDRGNYTHLGEIARGGMGAIIRVRDESLGRDLAMKVVLGEGGRVDTSAPGSAGPLARRFLEEAKITAQLDHPGVIPVHQFGTDKEGRLYFTMKLVEGGRTLADVFAKVREGDREFSRTRVLQVLVRVLETLAFAHQKGILHRDLKPANVMIGNFGEVYVMDWGLAKAAGAGDEQDLAIRQAADGGSSASAAGARAAAEGAGSGSGSGSAAGSGSGAGSRSGPAAASLTEVGQVLGTPTYMPIEQARGERLDARADVYAVGAMLYQLLSGSPPFGENGQARPGPEVLLRLLKGGPEPLSRVAPGVPPELVSITEKAMAREKDARYATAIEFARDLESFIEGRVVRAHKTGAVAELRKWIARNRALSGSLAAAVLLLVAGLAAFAMENRVARRNARMANENAALARTAAATADRERANAQRHAERMTRLAYASLVGRASSAISQGDGWPAVSYLAQCPKELRGWEWDMLARRVAGVKPLCAPDIPHHYYHEVALPPGDRIALAGGPPPMSWILWDLKANRLIARDSPAGHEPSWISFAPDGRTFVTTGVDEDVHLWDATSGKLLTRTARSTGSDGLAQAAVFSPDGRYIAAGSAAGVEILDGTDLSLVRSLGEVDGYGIGWSPDGRRVLATASAPSVSHTGRPAVLLDATTGAVLARGPVVRQSRIVEFSPDGTRVLLPMTLGGDVSATQVGVFDGATLDGIAVLDVWRGGGKAFIEAAAWDPAGELIATVASNDSKGLLRVHDAATARPVGETSMVQHARGLEFSADGARIRVGSCFTLYWEFEVGALTDRIAVAPDGGPADNEVFVEFLGGGSRVALGGEAGRLRSIDIGTGVARELALGVGKVHHLAATADDSALFAATSSGIWEAGLGAAAQPKRRNEIERSFSAVAVSSDGRFVVGGTGDFRVASEAGGELVIWDAVDGSCRTEGGLAGDVACLDFRPGSALVAVISTGTGEQSHDRGVYDVARGTWVWRARDSGADGEPRLGRCVAFDPAGRVIWTGALDGTVAAWDAATGAPLAARTVGTARIREIRPSGDGSRLFAVGSDHFLHVLEPVSLETFDDIDVGGEGINRDSEGWALAVHSGERTRVAVTRQMGNLLLLDPKWTTADVRSMTMSQGLLPSLAARHARLGFSGLVIDEIGPGLDDAQRADIDARLRAMDRPERLNRDAWDAVRFETGDAAAVAAAVRRAERCVELTSGDPAVLNTLGVARYRAGSIARAIEALERSRAGSRRGDAHMPTDTLFLAMARHKADEKEAAAALLLDARLQLTTNLDAWVSASPEQSMMRDELMRHWAEAERLIHGTLPPEFKYDLSQPPIAGRR